MLAAMAFNLNLLLDVIRRVPETGCREFTGSLDRAGYGRMCTGNREQKAHRFFYEACVGPVPAGMFLRLPARRLAAHCSRAWGRGATACLAMPIWLRSPIR